MCWQIIQGLSPTGSLYDIDVWDGEKLKLKNLILPSITLGIRPLSHCSAINEKFIIRCDEPRLHQNS
jgi:hypothetical protein